MSIDYDAVSVELLRALRGRRSCANFSHRAGYRSNIAHRWEKKQCWPTAAKYLELHQLLRRPSPSWLERFFPVLPAWATSCDPVSPEAVSAFLQHLKGKMSIQRIAMLSGRNRYIVSRWFDGRAQPRLPEFLQLVDVTSGRFLDVISAFEEPDNIPSLKTPWRYLQAAREIAYTHPWSHAVLRALELEGIPTGRIQQQTWIAAQLSIPIENVIQGLQLLKAAGQIRETDDSYEVFQVIKVDTSQDPLRARELKAFWAETALDRLRTGCPGTYGYAVFSISRADMARVRALQVQYARAMQEIIAASGPNECVGLYCVQLLALGDDPE